MISVAIFHRFAEYDEDRGRGAKMNRYLHAAVLGSVHGCPLAAIGFRPPEFRARSFTRNEIVSVRAAGFWFARK